MDFYIQMNILKGFFDILLNSLIESHKKLRTIFLNKTCSEMKNIDNVIDKICSLNSIF